MFMLLQAMSPVPSDETIKHIIQRVLADSAGNNSQLTQNVAILILCAILSWVGFKAIPAWQRTVNALNDTIKANTVQLARSEVAITRCEGMQGKFKADDDTSDTHGRSRKDTSDGVHAVGTR